MDNTADMFTRIRNAIKANKTMVEVIHSKKNLAILEVLKREGYVDSFKEIEVRPKIKVINVDLKYKNNLPSIREIKLRSKQQRREYSPIAKLDLVYNGLGISIISTSKGVMSDGEAREHNVGGEVICDIF